MSRGKQKTHIRSIQANKNPSSKGAMSVIEMASYVRPEIIEGASGNDEWVKYGVDNDYFDYVNDRYYGSPTNNAIVNGVSELIFGGGLRVEDGADVDNEKLDLQFPPNEVRKIAADFKRQGNAAFEVLWKGDGIGFTINHLPVETLRANKVNDEGEIEQYWFSNNWKDNENEPTPIPAFGFGKKTGKEIVYIRNYAPNQFYYSPPDYQGAIPYAELEEEIANFHISNIKNGFFPSAIINYNNGVPDKQTRQQIEDKTIAKFTGSPAAGKILLAFNESADNAVTVETFPLNDADKQYEFLSNEARKQLMVGHRITSPLLFGIKDATGFGNNADELRTASMLMDSLLVRPKQNTLTEAFEMVLESININQELFFENLQPLEVTEENQEGEIIPNSGSDNKSMGGSDKAQKEASYNGAQIASALEIMTSVKEGILTKEQATAFLIQMLQFEPSVAEALFSGDAGSVISELKSHKKKHNHNFTDSDGEIWIGELSGKGEVIDLDEFEILEEVEVEDAENEPLEFDFFKSKSNPQGKSKAGDSGLFKIRYRYSTNIKSDSRDFCKRMVSDSRGGTVYKREDITKMSRSGVNGNFAPEGKGSYSLWLYKGGVYCHHRWVRVVYRRKRDDKGRMLPASKTKALENDRKSTVGGAKTAGVPVSKVDPKAWNKASTPTIKQPNRGSLKNS